MSSLNKLVRERDSKNNSARQLEVTARPAETKRICIACRRAYPVWVEIPTDTYGFDRCPECSGALVSVTW